MKPFPTCPHCGLVEDDKISDMCLDDGESAIVACGSCGKNYRVTCDIRVQYESEKVANKPSIMDLRNF